MTFAPWSFVMDVHDVCAEYEAVHCVNNVRDSGGCEPESGSEKKEEYFDTNMSTVRRGRNRTWSVQFLSSFCHFVSGYPVDDRQQRKLFLHGQQDRISVGASI